jgi:hypothetical protein
MGKNPNAKKLKEKKFKERTYEHDIEDLEEEALRRGITIEELQREKGLIKDSDGSSSEEEQPKKKVQKKKQETSSEEEEKT